MPSRRGRIRVRRLGLFAALAVMMAGWLAAGVGCAPKADDAPALDHIEGVEASVEDGRPYLEFVVVNDWSVMDPQWYRIVRPLEPGAMGGRQLGDYPVHGSSWRIVLYESTEPDLCWDEDDVCVNVVVAGRDASYLVARNVGLADTWRLSGTGSYGDRLIWFEFSDAGAVGIEGRFDSSARTVTYVVQPGIGGDVRECRTYGETVHELPAWSPQWQESVYDPWHRDR